MTDLTPSINALPPEFEAVREYTEATSDYDRSANRRGLNHQAGIAFFLIDHADGAIEELLEALELRDKMLERAAGMFAKRASTPLYKNRPNEWLADLRASAERGT